MTYIFFNFMLGFWNVRQVGSLSTTGNIIKNIRNLFKLEKEIRGRFRDIETLFEEEDDIINQ